MCKGKVALFISSGTAGQTLCSLNVAADCVACCGELSSCFFFDVLQVMRFLAARVVSRIREVHAPRPGIGEPKRGVRAREINH
ncbi:uncharacterized protein EI90DRAFT_3070536 [Cantharellus anzutake]|uniref:uncharacterized protein n=1 Tax=Cantharellus anzutake TaxID=1750568 RepID=UPI001904BD2C|nr:uncharacterized protein EI90DRAFT_3083274 [Cantharellus anzutake]XP_038912848.1 uncharacterized protein EI90DRAFT_3070536 [Cantharellus anzutake]KAF8318628.1 hypothetical protein EI90DRAFT_3083274 [Cantharellus anzutake]KAF8326340.1 hypothetical protein EI90DRAFT_3070536 [Cantharellus anzutake]